MKRNIKLFSYKQFITGVLSFSIISSSILPTGVFAKEDDRDILIGDLSNSQTLGEIFTVDDSIQSKNNSVLTDTELYCVNKYTSTESLSTRFSFEDKLKLKVTPTSSTIDGTTANLYINDILVGTQPATLNNLITFEYELSKLTSLKEGNYPLKVVFTSTGGSNTTENLGDIYLEAIDIQPIFNTSKNYDATTKVTNVTATQFTCANTNVNVNGAITATFDVDTSSKNVGNYSMNSGQITLSNVRLVGDRSNHYKLTNNTSSTINSSSIIINPQPLSLSDQSIIVVANKTFDKTVNATLTSADIKFNGVAATEQFVKDVDYEISSVVFEDPWAGNTKPVHATIKFKSDKINNYKFSGSYDVIGTANITPASITDFKGYVLTKNYNSAETTEFDFNDLLVVSLQLDQITKTRNSLPANTFQIYVGDTPITAKATMSEPANHQYRIEAHLSQLVNLKEGTYPLKVVYGGDASTAKGEKSLGTIKISAVEIIPHMTQSVEKVYDGKTTTSVTTSSFSKVATSNSPYSYNSSVDSGSNKNMWGGTYGSEVGVTATFDIVSSSKDAGNYSSSNSGVSITNWKLEGARSNHYNLSTNNNTQHVNISIKKKDVTPEVVISDKVYDGKVDAKVSKINFKGAVEGESFLENVDYVVNSSKFKDASIGNGKEVTSTIQFLTNGSNTLKNYNVLGSNTIISKGNILKSDGEIVNQNILDSKGKPCREFDFDDIVRVTGTPKARSTKYNKVEVYIDDVKVSTVDCKLDNTFTTDISLDEFYDISHGKNNVRVVWTGDNSNGSIEADYGTITINAIPIEIEVSESVEYNGTKTYTIKTDKVTDKDSDKKLDLSVRADVKIESKDVGDRKITSATNIKITGDYANRYELDDDDIDGKLNVTKRSIKPSSARVVVEDNGSLRVSRVTFKGLAEDEYLTIDKDFTAKAEYKNRDKGEVIVKIELKNTNVSNNYSLSTTSIDEEINKPIEEEELIEELNKTLFADMGSHWAKQAVEYLSKLGIINGYPDNTFRPNNFIIRGDMAVISDRTISTLNHKLNSSKESKFKDVKENQYYYNSIQKLADTQIFSGYPDGTFKPDNFITREESFVVISKFIDKYVPNLPTTNNTVKYNDYDKVSEWAKPYLDNLNKHGIVKGDTKGKVNPHERVTRAEISQMIYNILINNK